MVRLLDFDSALSREGVFVGFVFCIRHAGDFGFPICISLGFLLDALINCSYQLLSATLFSLCPCIALM